MKIKFQVLVLTIIAGLFLYSCWSDQVKKGNDKGTEDQKDKKGKFTGEKKYYWENGNLKASIMYVDGMREGINKNYSRSGKLLSIVPFSQNMINGESKQYYFDGKLNSTINYVNDTKHGLERWYYENGKLYQVSNYKYGKLDGMKIRYYDNGKLMCEAPFKEGQPGLGLKEYNKDGSLKKRPYIIVTETDNTKTTREYIITFKLSDGSSSTRFYAGKLTDDKYFNSMLSPVPSKHGVGKTVLNVKKGTFIMHSVNIVAKRKTLMKNYYIVSKKINIAAENR